MVWVVNAKPWDNTFTLTSWQTTAPNNRVLQGTVGGWTLINGNTDYHKRDIEQCLQLALKDMTKPTGALGDTEQWRATKVISAYEQVVEGLRYKITAEFANGDDTSLVTAEFVVYVAPRQDGVVTSVNILSRDDEDFGGEL